MSFERNLIQSYNKAHIALVTGRPREQILIREPVLQGIKNDLKNAQATIGKLEDKIKYVENINNILQGSVRFYRDKISNLCITKEKLVAIDANNTEGPATNFPTIRQIVDLVSLNEGISVTDILSVRRPKPICRARHYIYYLCKTMTVQSLPTIGKFLGGRDHTTVIHGIRVVEKLRQKEPLFNARIHWYEKTLTEVANGTAV